MRKRKEKIRIALRVKTWLSKQSPDISGSWFTSQQIGAGLKERWQMLDLILGDIGIRREVGIERSAGDLSLPHMYRIPHRETLIETQPHQEESPAPPPPALVAVSSPMKQDAVVHRPAEQITTIDNSMNSLPAQAKNTHITGGQDKMHHTVPTRKDNLLHFINTYGKEGTCSRVIALYFDYDLDSAQSAVWSLARTGAIQRLKSPNNAPDLIYPNGVQIPTKYDSKHPALKMPPTKSAEIAEELREFHRQFIFQKQTRSMERQKEWASIIQASTNEIAQEAPKDTVSTAHQQEERKMLVRIPVVEMLPVTPTEQPSGKTPTNGESHVYFTSEEGGISLPSESDLQARMDYHTEQINFHTEQCERLREALAWQQVFEAQREEVEAQQKRLAELRHQGLAILRQIDGESATKSQNTTRAH